MRRWFLLPAILVGFCGLVRAEDELPNESVLFDGQKLVCAFQGENPGETFWEYVPVGEKLDSWVHLASIREYPELNDISEFVGAMVRALKEQNSQAKSAILENESTGEVILDFVTWPADGSYAEFNVWRFSKADEGGIVAEQYAVRNYDNPTEFMKNLRPLRLRLVDLMSKDGLKVVEEK